MSTKKNQSKRHLFLSIIIGIFAVFAFVIGGINMHYANTSVWGNEICDSLYEDEDEDWRNLCATSNYTTAVLYSEGYVNRSYICFATGVILLAIAAVAAKK